MPAGHEKNGAARTRGGTLRKAQPAGAVDQKREPQRDDEDRVERPADAVLMPAMRVSGRGGEGEGESGAGSPHLQHPGMITAARNGRIVPIAKSAHAISPTAATNRRAGGSLCEPNTRQEPSAPAPMIARPTRVPMMTTSGLPTRQSWNVASDPSWCWTK